VKIIIGSIIITISIILRLVAKKQLGTNFNIRVITPNNLITTGVYKYVRHPIYTSALLLLFGLTLLVSNWFMACIIFLCAWCSYFDRIEREEKMMYMKFGEKYMDYIKRSWMLIPFLL
jgi:protein-S-isoprenylcysteine O-methyltransferase Ste14